MPSMNQCPSCSSFNEPRAAFCNQCGLPLAGRPGRKGRGIFRRRASFIAGLIFLAAGILLVVRPWSRPSAAPRGDVGALPALREPGAESSGEEEKPVEAEAEEAPLDEETLRRLGDRMIVSVLLNDAAGELLRETKGVLVEPGGQVLCRFRPLLGAHAGTCRLGRRNDPAREVVGLVGRDFDRNLALLEVRHERTSTPLHALAVAAPGPLPAGTELAVLGVGQAVKTRVGDAAYFTADGVAHVRLAGDPPLPLNVVAAVDPFGSVLGLCVQAPPLPPELAAESGERPRILVDPLDRIVEALGKPASISLEEVTRRYYEGTFDDLRERGQKALQVPDLPAAIDLLVKALDQADREKVGDEAVQGTLDLLRKAIEGELARRRQEKDLRGLEALLVTATARYPQERKYWLELGAVRVDLGEHREAIEALVAARRLETGTDVDALIQEAYLAGAAREASLSHVPVAAEWLENGVAALPTSGRLHLELAKLYYRWGLYDDAARVYSMARALDATLAQAVESGLEEIRNAVDRREALVIPIPPEATSIPAIVTLNARLNFKFIIDTGATYTSITQEMAEALGYGIGQDTERVLISTANGVVSAPVVILDSVSLGGYGVRNLKAIVLPQRSQPGLLGLNYLQNFRFSVDSGRREFRLEKR
jgi:clan AA aspartic protease (TIGR02281 family)